MSSWKTVGLLQATNNLNLYSISMKYICKCFHLPIFMIQTRWYTSRKFNLVKVGL